MKNKFTADERAALVPFPKGSGEEKAERGRIEKMSTTWDRFLTACDVTNGFFVDILLLTPG